MLRYVLVAMSGALTVTAPAPPDEPVPDRRTDLTASLVSQSDTGVVLGFPTYDPAAVQAPAETQIFLVPAGQPVPTDGQAFVDSAYPRTVATDPVPVEGSASYPVRFPAADAGPYNWYAVHGYAS